MLINNDIGFTQNLIAELFGVGRSTITEHINNILNSDELEQNTTSKKFLLVQSEGNREVKRSAQYYNLDMVISIGYKVNSERAIQFRRLATYIFRLKIDKNYLKSKKM